MLAVTYTLNILNAEHLYNEAAQNLKHFELLYDVTIENLTPDSSTRWGTVKTEVKQEYDPDTPSDCV